jgi:hypothetical protein
MGKIKKKNVALTQKEHNEWHRKNKGYDTKDEKEHDLCHNEMGIVVKKS